MATKTGHTVGKKSKTVVGKSNKSNDGGKKQPHHSFHKKPLFIGGGIAALLLLVILIAVSLVSSRSISAFNLISDYAKKADYIEDVIKTDDPDGIMGSSHMYTSKSSWEDSRLNDIVEAHAGTVEVFRNSKDAELREWYLDKTSEACINISPPQNTVRICMNRFVVV